MPYKYKKHDEFKIVNALDEKLRMLFDVDIQLGMTVEQAKNDIYETVRWALDHSIDIKTPKARQKRRKK